MTIEIIRPTSREAWLELRKQDVTASQAAALLGVHPYATAYQLWGEKTGRASEREQNAGMKRGLLLEPIVAQLVREERPEWLLQYPLNSTYYRDPARRIGATPDAFATVQGEGSLGIVQFKTASDWAWKKWLDPDTREVVLPLWIAVQAIIEAELTGATWAAVAVLVVGHAIEMYIIDIPLHAGIMSAIDKAVANFWDIIERGGHPPIDWLKDGAAVLDHLRDSDGSRADLSENSDFDELVAKYVAAKAEARKYERDAEELKPQIVHALGNADIGETLEWLVSAKTTHRKGYTVEPTSFRALRCKRKETT